MLHRVLGACAAAHMTCWTGLGSGTGLRPAQADQSGLPIRSPPRVCFHPLGSGDSRPRCSFSPGFNSRASPTPAGAKSGLSATRKFLSTTELSSHCPLTVLSLEKSSPAGDQQSGFTTVPMPSCQSPKHELGCHCLVLRSAVSLEYMGNVQLLELSSWYLHLMKPGPGA
ncbi:hypothetical protein H8959_000922 [Pygathrix nigripes]